MADEVDDMSAASRGSQPVAWMVEWTDHADFFLHRPDAEMVAAGDMAVQSLYREPQPTLTDAEREALRRMLPTIMYEPHRVAVESILQRLG